ncbi:hypothetical protein EYF80_009941 [Liparis tanakae]|uniref:Uncharacterized protein n=1 Tax=Liparis tanakae TaxID=230148 RepID=A0A4Z2IQU7_9TELE|nr:hypothetical protein EYF80_009941 [Liparis tanakae]
MASVFEEEEADAPPDYRNYTPLHRLAGGAAGIWGPGAETLSSGALGPSAGLPSSNTLEIMAR